MSAKDLPDRGEVYAGARLSKFVRCTLGALTGDVLGVAQTTYALFNVPAGFLVLSLRCYTITAWSSSVTLNFGDGTDTDGWLATAKVAPTSAQTNGIVKCSDVSTAEALSGGKYYAAADTIDVLIGGATPAVGLTYVWVEYIPHDATTL